MIPKLGRHYLEVWEEADIAMYGGPLPGFSSGRMGESSTSPPKWDPSTLMEADLLTEERSHGPLTERLMSALLPMPDSTVWKGVKAAEDAMEGRPGGTGAAAAKREKVNVIDLEERVQDTMRFHGLLHEPVSLGFSFRMRVLLMSYHSLITRRKSMTRSRQPLGMRNVSYGPW